MGITLNDLQTLQEKGVLTPDTKSVLDIGSSNLYQASNDGLQAFLHFYGLPSGHELDDIAERLAKGSTYDPIKGGTNDSFVGELLEAAGLRYEAIDIADGYRTTILDLNHQNLPPDFIGLFDVVLNFGTTEHLLNQYNAFKVIHDSIRKGGHIVHSIPCVGYSNHGYITYTPRCFLDLAAHNKYQIVDFWFSGPGASNNLLQPLTDYSSYFPSLIDAISAIQSKDLGKYISDMELKDISLQVIFKKVRDRPFAGALETTTSVGNVPDVVRKLYKGNFVPDKAQLARKSKSLRGFISKILGK